MGITKEDLTLSYSQFLGAMLIIGLVVMIGYLVLIVQGQRELAALREKITSVGVAESSHLREADIWIAKIKKLESQVEALVTLPQARKDPFTGTQGLELEARINTLEEQLKKLQ